MQKTGEIIKDDNKNDREIEIFEKILFLIIKNMPNIKDLTIILKQSISRAYLQFYINGLTENKLIYLRPKSIFQIYY